MRTLRQNCLGMKPCPLEFLSDAASVFEGAFPQVNYEDPDINVSIPVFSIHGNHDDPSGDGNYCSLDLLQAAGLLNYFGRVAEADNIEVKPILLQKGVTKLALLGLSNVRDERMFRSFRDHKVKWFRPNVQMSDWFHLLAVHQNHHAHTATSYLPENVLPDWLDLVVWGHEHECLIDPTQNPETGFHVMQPGSSIATSLVAGEAVQKHVAIVSVTGKEFKVDKFPLKSVRPFVTRELVLAQDKRFKDLAQKKDNRQEITRRLMMVIEEMIEEASAEWNAIQDDEENLSERPLPLVRLKVEYTASGGGVFECENPQRFSNRFVGKVANTNDVVYFYRKKTLQREEIKRLLLVRGLTTLTGKANPALPSDVVGTLDGVETVKVESLVQDFLGAQSLRVLPQGPFGDAVNQFVAKDDKHAMELFVSEHLTGQVKQLLGLESDDEDLNSAMEIYRTKMEKQLTGGIVRASADSTRRRILKPKPDTWDTDFDGNWEDEPDAWVYEQLTNRGTLAPENEQQVDQAQKKANDDGAQAAGQRTMATATVKGKKASARKSATTTIRAHNGERSSLSEEDDEVLVMETEGEHSSTRLRVRGRKPPAKRDAPAKTKRSIARSDQKSKQTKTNFSPKGGGRSQKTLEMSDDEISDDDAFEPAPVSSRTRRR